LKILLTGATGFVGKAVHTKLGDDSVRLTARSKPLDNSAEFFEKEISSITDFSECLKDIDVVIHTAARVHQMDDRAEDPLLAFMEVNCYGTLNLAKQAASAGVKRFIFISSMKVNGERTELGIPFRFDDIPAANDPYGISKYKAEGGLLEIGKNTKLDIVIIRPPLVYGPGVKANFQSLINLSQRCLPLPLGAVNNKRGFVAIDNLVDLILTCTDHPNAINKIFLISDDSDIATSDLVNLIANAFGRKAWLLNINPTFLKLVAKILGKRSIVDRLCDDFQIDIQYTKDTLDWKPPISMVEGIQLCAEYAKK
tara:strand:- start:803 stop:1735 length:933 start_codon:yes stop_codon:yes gene_type:complete